MCWLRVWGRGWASRAHRQHVDAYAGSANPAIMVHDKRGLLQCPRAAGYGVLPGAQSQGATPTVPCLTNAQGGPTHRPEHLGWPFMHRRTTEFKTHSHDTTQGFMRLVSPAKACQVQRAHFHGPMAHRTVQLAESLGFRGPARRKARPAWIARRWTCPGPSCACDSLQSTAFQLPSY